MIRPIILREKIVSIASKNTGNNYRETEAVIWLRQFFSFAGKNYLSLDWHPRAKELFYNEKAAEEVRQDESFLQKNSTPANKQQSVSLNECLELYTTTEKLKEDNAW